MNNIVPKSRLARVNGVTVSLEARGTTIGRGDEMVGNP